MVDYIDIAEFVIKNNQLTIDKKIYIIIVITNYWLLKKIYYSPNLTKLEIFIKKYT